jgi:hypothetical protein
VGTAVDLEGLLVALTIAPTTFSRNRFFALYIDPAARRVRRRAALLRSVVGHLGAGSGAQRVTLAQGEGGRALIAYELPALGLRRTVALDPLELAAVRFALARGQPAGPVGGCAAAPDVLAVLRPEPSDGPQVEAALSRLLPEECYEVG